jgi:type I restriction enzyme S subunit
MQQLGKLRKTELAPIPKEWSIKNLSEIGEIIGGGTPDTTRKEYWEHGNIAWTVPTDLTDLKTNYINKTQKYITKDGLDNSSAKLLPVGSVLITSRATIGECAITAIPITTNQGFQNLICNKENNNVFFLYTIKFNKAKLIRRSHGTTFLEISKNNIKNLKLLIPPLKEQQKIASILSKVDELIQKTQKCIKAQQELYETLLNFAFVGKLTEKWRKTYQNKSQSDVAQVQSKVGGEKMHQIHDNMELDETENSDVKLPAAWKWTRLGELLEYLTDYHANGSYAILKSHVTLLDTPNYACVIRATNFVKNDFIYSMKYFTKESYNFLSKSKLYGGEILIGKIGNAGSVYYMPNLHRPASLGMNLFALKTSTNVDSKYIYFHLLSEFSKKDIQRHIKGVGNPSIDKKSVRSLYIALPTLEEQRKIVDILDSILLTITKNIGIESKLKLIKKGLMQQLLSGKIRVKV